MYLHIFKVIINNYYRVQSVSMIDLCIMYLQYLYIMVYDECICVFLYLYNSTGNLVIQVIQNINSYYYYIFFLFNRLHCYILHHIIVVLYNISIYIFNFSQFGPPLFFFQLLLPRFLFLNQKYITSRLIQPYPLVGNVLNCPRAVLRNIEITLL